MSAQDKATGKSQKIIITAEKGRLSEEEIERAVQEAEAFAEEDRRMKVSHRVTVSQSDFNIASRD